MLNCRFSLMADARLIELTSKDVYHIQLEAKHKTNNISLALEIASIKLIHLSLLPE